MTKNTVVHIYTDRGIDFDERDHLKVDFISQDCKRISVSCGEGTLVDYWALLEHNSTVCLVVATAQRPQILLVSQSGLINCIEMSRQVCLINPLAASQGFFLISETL